MVPLLSLDKAVPQLWTAVFPPAPQLTAAGWNIYYTLAWLYWPSSSLSSSLSLLDPVVAVAAAGRRANRVALARGNRLAKVLFMVCHFCICLVADVWICLSTRRF